MERGALIVLVFFTSGSHSKMLLVLEIKICIGLPRGLTPEVIFGFGLVSGPIAFVLKKAQQSKSCGRAGTLRVLNVRCEDRQHHELALLALCPLCGSRAYHTRTGGERGKTENTRTTGNDDRLKSNFKME